MELICPTRGNQALKQPDVSVVGGGLVVVRFVGIAYRGKLLSKAGVQVARSN